MKPPGPYLPGSVLPTVVAVSAVMLTAMLGLAMLWEHETLLFTRSVRLRQARADIESAYVLYRLHPRREELTGSEGYLLCDSLPQSRVFIDRRDWGLYEAVRVRKADSLLCVCRLLGSEAETAYTLYYADSHSAVTLAGRTRLEGTLRLPQNGLIYGRMGADFHHGPEIPRTAVRQSRSRLPQPDSAAARRMAACFAEPKIVAGTLPDSVFHSFGQDFAAVFSLGDTTIGNCTLRGQIVLLAGELRIDSTCRMAHTLVIARKIVVASGARITAQLIARDTVIVGPRTVLEHPSGIRAGRYAELGDRAEVNGYAIVCDTAQRSEITANYRQSRTARLRGLLHVDGTAQMQGIVSGAAVVRQAVYFSPQGYYKDMLYDFTLLENPLTAHPLWLAAGRRKEAAWVD